ncbi:MAG: hypothetical protein K0B08_00685 [Bacteroidales bacterium]|nr:hypothetical protein [Bacteroidales bacterium]
MIKYFHLSFLLFLVTGPAWAQQEIGPGKTNLQKQQLIFAKTICDITPQVQYDTNKRHELTIKFYADWKNKDGEPFQNNEHYLYLIDNFDKWMIGIKENDKYLINFSPRQKQSILQATDQITENGMSIKPVYSNGYLELINVSQPLKLRIDGKDGDLITLNLFFTYVTAKPKNKNIEDIPRQLAWSFSLPGKTPVPDEHVAIMQEETEIAEQEIKDTIKKEKEKEIIAPRPEPPVKEKVKKEDTSRKDIENKIDSLAKKYNVIYHELASQFESMKGIINPGMADIGNRIRQNDERFSMVQEMFSVKDQLSEELFENMSLGLTSCKSDNQYCDSSNTVYLTTIRTFKSKIEQEISHLLSEFQNIDRRTMPLKGTEIQNKLKDLFSEVSVIEATLEKLQTSINAQNKDIYSLFMELEGKVELAEKISAFDLAFNQVNLQLEGLVVDYDNLKSNFENKKFSKGYFKWVRQSYLKKADNIINSYAVINSTFDSLSHSKRSSFQQYDLDPLIESQQGFEKERSGFVNRVEILKASIIESEYEPFPFLYTALAIIFISILIFGTYVYLMALRRKKLKISPILSTSRPAKNAIKIQPTMVTASNKGKGLADYLKPNKDRYLELNMSHEWADSCVKNVYFERDCIIKTYRFFEDSIHSVGTTEHSANETGGYLIGQWDYNPDEPDKYDVSLEDFIEPGDDASFSKYQLNFGAKIGVKLQSVLENMRQKSNRDFVMTAWFHSHPGLKIFLSDYDLQVQNDFAGTQNKHRMLALVLDPYTPAWDLGIFPYKANGDMNNAADSIRFFSFDSIYHWALTPPRREIVQFDNYFAHDISRAYSGTSIRNILFSLPGILEIKRFIENAKLQTGKNFTTGLFSGFQHNPGSHYADLAIEQVLSEEDWQQISKPDEKKIIGAIFFLASVSEDNAKALNDKIIQLTETYGKNLVIALFSPADEGLSLLPADIITRSLISAPDKSARVPLPELIEWTRKRK